MLVRCSSISAARLCSARARRSASSASSRAICPSESCRSWSRRVWVSSSWARSDSSAARRSSSNSRRSDTERSRSSSASAWASVSTCAALAVARDAHVVHLVLGDAHHLLQPLAHPVHGARDDRQLGDLLTQPLQLGPGVVVGRAGGLRLVAAGVPLPGQGAHVLDRGVAAGRRRVELGAEPAQSLIHLGAVVAPPHHAEGCIVELGCHWARTPRSCHVGTTHGQECWNRLATGEVGGRARGPPGCSTNDRRRAPPIRDGVALPGGQGPVGGAGPGDGSPVQTITASTTMLSR